MKPDDSELDDWIRYRRREAVATGGISGAVLDRIRNSGAKPEREHEKGDTASFPKPVLAAGCFLIGAAKVLVALRLAF